MLIVFEHGSFASSIMVLNTSLTPARLIDKVIDIECAHGSPHPTIDPSVHTILIGHSMGGIVAAETYLLLSSEQPIPAKNSAMNPETPNFPSNTTQASSTSTSHPNPKAQKRKQQPIAFMFPHVQGVLAFDTPFLGLAPSMFAHGLEGGHKVASGAWDTASEVAKAFGWGAKSEPNLTSSSNAQRMLPAASDPNFDAAAVPRWQTWGKYAMYAGAAGAVAAGGAAAVYSQREKITTGYGWVQSHLLFVGALIKVEELKKRVENLEKATSERGGGCANLYTKLGKAARDGWGVTETVASGTGKEGGVQVGRTFCHLPQKAKEEVENGKTIEQKKTGEGMTWLPTINDKARDETTAHMNMFTPRDNPGFYSLGEKAKTTITGWIDQGWYASSEKKEGQVDAEMGIGDGWVTPDLEEEQKDHTGIGKGWEGMQREKSMEPDVKLRDAHKENWDRSEELEDSVIVERAGGEA